MALEIPKRELTLVKKAIRGNPKAFGELIREQQEYLYRMAFLYTREEQDALDAVQESIIKAYKSMKNLREPEHFKTWLTRIVINEAKRILQKRRVDEELDTVEGLPALESLSAEERMDLYAALEHLPNRYREIVQLRYFDGLTNREIAAQLDLPEGTVSSSLSRAINLMRSEIKEEIKC